MMGKGRSRLVPDWIDRDVGKRVLNLRKAQNLTQSKLADRCGVSFQQIQKYERGDNRISVSMLWQMAQALGVPLASLLPPAKKPRDGDLGKIADEPA